METDVSISEGILQASNGAGLAEEEEAWLGFRATASAVLLLELLLGVGGNLTVLVLYCGHCSLVESVSHAVTLSLHMLDLLLCLLCLPITATILLLGGHNNHHHTLLCCFHEAAATFASVGTALNLLLISLDRYDISVRPANRLLTPTRAAILLSGVWIVTLAVPLLPFMEAGLDSEFTDTAVHSNSTLLCSKLVGTLQAHLLLQVPIFLCSLAVMLFTYSRIMQALHIRIGHPARAQRETMQLVRRPCKWHKKTATCPDHVTHAPFSPAPISTGPLMASDTITTVTVTTETNPSVHTPLSPNPTGSILTTPFSSNSTIGLPLAPASSTTNTSVNPTISPINTHLNFNLPLSNTPINPSPSASTIASPSNPATSVSSVASPLVTSPSVPTITLATSISAALSPIPCHVQHSVGVGASVSAILTLRRAVRRHRDRRERQKRVFRMSVIIVLSFFLCWAPLSMTPILWLATGPSDWLEHLRVCFLVLAYWTVVLHPLLYAFTRQKLRKVFYTRLRRLWNNNLKSTEIQKKSVRQHKHRHNCSDATDRCLKEAVKE